MAARRPVAAVSRFEFRGEQFECLISALIKQAEPACGRSSRGFMVGLPAAVPAAK